MHKPKAGITSENVKYRDLDFTICKFCVNIVVGYLEFYVKKKDCLDWSLFHLI